MATVNPDDLTSREGKVLRYFVARKAHGEDQTATDDCIVEVPWSDLPHSHNQALLAVRSLLSKGLLARVEKGWYTPTEDGITLIGKANKAKLWQAAPPPSVTNTTEHIDSVVTDYNKADKHRPVPKHPGKLKPKPKPKPKPKAKGIIRIKKKASK